MAVGAPRRGFQRGAWRRLPGEAFEPRRSRAVTAGSRRPPPNAATAFGRAGAPATEIATRLSRAAGVRARREACRRGYAQPPDLAVIGRPLVLSSRGERQT